MSVSLHTMLLGFFMCIAAAAAAAANDSSPYLVVDASTFDDGEEDSRNATTTTEEARRLQNQDVYYAPLKSFNINRDLLSLHYDNAPDRDDAHSAAMDRVILQDKWGCGSKTEAYWPVQGTYGTNKPKFVPGSTAVMDAVWNGCGGYIDAHKNWANAVTETAAKWKKVIRDGGRIFIKEGGQSDFTADVLRKMTQLYARKLYNKPKKFFIVQHSDWNEDHTTPSDLTYVKRHAMYTRIDDANPYLKSTRRAFVEEFNRRAIAHPTYGAFWKKAIDFYDTHVIVDFSDTGELMHILEMPPYNCQQLMEMYL